jgi:hypothetical protein
MRSYKEVPTTRMETDIITCDRCGFVAGPEDWEVKQNFYEFAYTGAYGSEWFGDMVTATADICEKCLYEMVGHFVQVDEDLFEWVDIEEI